LTPQRSPLSNKKKFPSRPTYFSDSTNSLIDKYCSFIGSSSFSEPTKHYLHRQVKKSIRKDRKSKLTQDLEIDSRSGPAERWCKLKQVRSKYTPCPPCIKSSDGSLLPSNQRAEALATYLSEQVWSVPEPTTGSLPAPDFEPISLPLSQISLSDVTLAISRFKTNRSPGTDGIQPELLIYSPLSF
jgi:hypothetical protein